MKKLTYKEAYDKIIEAYFKDEIQPYNEKFCFCGTLAYSGKRWVNYDYKTQELRNMEAALLITLRRETIGFTTEPVFMNYQGANAYLEIEQDDSAYTNNSNYPRITNHKNYEDALFNGMCAALEVLKQIHKERGEDVDGVQAFTKRKLALLNNSD